MKILWFDDEVDLLYLCVIMLNKDGHTVITSETYADMIKTVGQAQPDVIIMDNSMPGMTGLEAIALLKESEFQKIPVIFCTGHAGVSEIALHLGIHSFISKPFSIAYLEKLLARACNGQDANDDNNGMIT